jgi:hypothetical protein
MYTPCTSKSIRQTAGISCWSSSRHTTYYHAHTCLQTLSRTITGHQSNSDISQTQTSVKLESFITPSQSSFIYRTIIQMHTQRRTIHIHVHNQTVFARLPFSDGKAPIFAILLEAGIVLLSPTSIGLWPNKDDAFRLPVRPGPSNIIPDVMLIERPEDGRLLFRESSVLRRSVSLCIYSHAYLDIYVVCVQVCMDRPSCESVFVSWIIIEAKSSEHHANPVFERLLAYLWVCVWKARAANTHTHIHIYTFFERLLAYLWFCVWKARAANSVRFVCRYLVCLKVCVFTIVYQRRSAYLHEKLTVQVNSLCRSVGLSKSTYGPFNMCLHKYTH